MIPPAAWTGDRGVPAVVALDDWAGGFEREKLQALVATVVQQLREVIDQIRQDTQK